MALIALEAVCQQGTSTDPLSYPSRILEVIMFCAFMFVYVAYSANILVLLQSTTEIKNLEEIREFKIDYGGMNTSNMMYYQDVCIFNLIICSLEVYVAESWTNVI